MSSTKHLENGHIRSVYNDTCQFGIPYYKFNIIVEGPYVTTSILDVTLFDVTLCESYIDYIVFDQSLYFWLVPEEIECFKCMMLLKKWYREGR